nr:ribonuclease H-like domain-containing protein [Tanacetum cinerariifolium]
MEIELPGDLKEIPTKLETFTSTISNLSSQLKILDSLLSLLHKVTDTLNRFAAMVENASGSTSMDVPSAGKAAASPAEREKNTKDADTNMKDELVDFLGKNIMTQYYTKKEDGSDEVILNLKKVYKAGKRLLYVKRNKAISLGNVTSKVGIEVHQLSLKDCTCRTPIDTGSKLGDDGDPLSDPTLYRSLAGSIQYLTFTRPDISYAVQKVCLYMHDPWEPPFSTLKRILRFGADEALRRNVPKELSRKIFIAEDYYAD